MSKWEIFYRQFIEKDGYKIFLQGLENTLLIAIFGLIIGLILGSILATFKLLPSDSASKILKIFTNIYVAIFRGTPMVVQLLIIHFIIFPSIGISLDGWIEGMLAFGLNSAAYVCEIMRGGILSVDKGQTEAGKALGLNYSMTMTKIVIPQAIKNVVPTLGNEFISLIKETSIVSFIAVVDVTKAFQNIANSTYEYFIPYIMLALTYLVLVLIITLLIKVVERRLRLSDKH